MSKFLPGFEITSWGGLCGPADAAKFRADNEARLAPIIKASGARVE